MKKLSLLVFFGWQVLHADTSDILVVNGASFLADTSLAPGALISIFGPNLGNATASATDFTHLPLTLAGVSVTFRGSAQPLLFVSKTQINARLDSSISPGAGALTVTSPAGSFTKDIVISAQSTPGAFSLFGTGTRDGAIQNAVTYALGPYTVTTNGKPTYLAIYTTGLDLSVAPTVTIGGLTVPLQFYGAAPCCPGLQQLNVQLAPGLAGAGRVEVAVTSGGKTSNIVEVVILPNPGQGPYPARGENQARSRELSAIAYVPNASHALVTDENDDVVRVLDIQLQAVIGTITLPEGAQPAAIAVNSSGTLAVVAERNRGKVAILDVAASTVAAEVAVGSGPSSVTIAGSSAVVANQDSDSVSVVDLYTHAVKTVSVGRGPRGVTVDVPNSKAYVTNQDDGTLSVVDLAYLQTTPAVIHLPANARPAAIQIVPSLRIAVITEPSSSSNARIYTLILDTGAVGTGLINSNRNGGANDLAVYGNRVYFTDQAGGVVSVASMGVGSAVHYTTTMASVDLGDRAAAVDATDRLLLVANQGSGTVVLVDLFSSEVAGRINAVRSEHEGSTARDDASDRETALNRPTIGSIDPANASGGTSFTLTITGTNLQDAGDIFFVDPATLPGQAGFVPGDEHWHGPFGVRDKNITVSNIQVITAGTKLTATVTIANSSPRGKQRVVRVEARNGDTSFVASPVNTFRIN